MIEPAIQENHTGFRALYPFVVVLPDGTRVQATNPRHARRIKAAWFAGQSDGRLGRPRRTFPNPHRPQQTAYNGGYDQARGAA